MSNGLLEEVRNVSEEEKETLFQSTLTAVKLSFCELKPVGDRIGVFAFKPIEANMPLIFPSSSVINMDPVDEDLVNHLKDTVCENVLEIIHRLWKPMGPDSLVLPRAGLHAISMVSYIRTSDDDSEKNVGRGENGEMFATKDIAEGEELVI